MARKFHPVLLMTLLGVAGLLQLCSAIQSTTLAIRNTPFTPASPQSLSSHHIQRWCQLIYGVLTMQAAAVLFIAALLVYNARIHGDTRASAPSQPTLKQTAEANCCRQDPHKPSDADTAHAESTGHPGTASSPLSDLVHSLPEQADGGVAAAPAVVFLLESRLAPTFCKHVAAQRVMSAMILLLTMWPALSQSRHAQTAHGVLYAAQLAAAAVITTVGCSALLLNAACALWPGPTYTAHFRLINASSAVVHAFCHLVVALTFGIPQGPLCFALSLAAIGTDFAANQDRVEAFGAQLLAATSTFVTAQIVIAAGNPGSHAVWWLCQAAPVSTAAIILSAVFYNAVACEPLQTVAVKHRLFVEAPRSKHNPTHEELSPPESKAITSRPTSTTALSPDNASLTATLSTLATLYTPFSTMHFPPAPDIAPPEPHPTNPRPPPAHFHATHSHHSTQLHLLLPGSPRTGSPLRRQTSWSDLNLVSVSRGGHHPLHATTARERRSSLAPSEATWQGHSSLSILSSAGDHSGPAAPPPSDQSWPSPKDASRGVFTDRQDSRVMTTMDTDADWALTPNAWSQSAVFTSGSVTQLLMSDASMDPSLAAVKSRSSSQPVLLGRGSQGGAVQRGGRSGRHTAAQAAVGGSPEVPPECVVGFLGSIQEGPPSKDTEAKAHEWARKRHAATVRRSFSFGAYNSPQQRLGALGLVQVQADMGTSFVGTSLQPRAGHRRLLRSISLPFVVAGHAPRPFSVAPASGDGGAAPPPQQLRAPSVDDQQAQGGSWASTMVAAPAIEYVSLQPHHTPSLVLKNDLTHPLQPPTDNQHQQSQQSVLPVQQAAMHPRARQGRHLQPGFLHPASFRMPIPTLRLPSRISEERTRDSVDDQGGGSVHGSSTSNIQLAPHTLAARSMSSAAESCPLTSGSHLNTHASLVDHSAFMLESVAEERLGDRASSALLQLSQAEGQEGDKAGPGAGSQVRRKSGLKPRMGLMMKAFRKAVGK